MPVFGRFFAKDRGISVPFAFHDQQKFDALQGKTLLVCVGAMKCATSWIYHYLATLPGVVVSPLKEVHFFNRRYAAHALSDMDGLSLKRLAFHIEQEGNAVENLMRRPAFRASLDRVQMIYDDDAYFGHFARIARPGSQTFCDITPAYSTIGADGFAYMRDFCAAQGVTLKILFVMRDPVDRLWSQLRHITQASPDEDFLENWREALDLPRVMARSDYRFTVQDVDATFPAENVMYLFYENLFAEASLRRLSGFAGSDFLPGEPEIVRNGTDLKRDLPAEVRDAFRSALDAEYAFCRQRFLGEVPDNWLP